MSVEIYATLGEPHEIAATLSALRYLVFQGKKGDTGDSAYEVAVENGFSGTEEEWLESLKNGPKGADGYTPTITTQEVTGGVAVTISDGRPSGTTSTCFVRDGVDGTDGTDGTDGEDGVSPTVAVSSITGGHRLTITDADHPSGQTVDVMDGEDYNLTAQDKADIAGSQEVAGVVTDWLDENISAETEVVIDSSLSVSGAAADAAAVGAALEIETPENTPVALDGSLDLFFTTANPTMRSGAPDVCKTAYVSCQPNTTYTITKNISAAFAVGWTVAMPASGTSAQGVLRDVTQSSLTITTGSGAAYLVIYYAYNDADPSAIYSSILVAKGSCVSLKSAIQALETTLVTLQAKVTDMDTYQSDSEAALPCSGVLRGTFIKASATPPDLRGSGGDDCRVACFACEPNTTYTVNKDLSNAFTVGYTTQTPANSNVPVYGVVAQSSATQLSVTTGADATHIVVYYAYKDATSDAILDSIRVLSQGAVAQTITLKEKIAEIDEKISSPVATGTRDVPQNRGVLNAYKRAHQLIDLPFTLKAPVPAQGGASMISAGAKKGMLYSELIQTDTYVGFQVSLRTFMTAVNNPYSVLYTENCNSNHSQSGYGKTYLFNEMVGSYYGTVCSDFVNWSLGMPPWYSYGYNWMRRIGVFEEVYDNTGYGVQLMDVIHKGSHVQLITDIYRDARGVPTQIHVSESVPNHVKTTVMNVEQVTTLLQGGQLLRYKDLYKSLDYEASPFVAVEDETAEGYTYNDDICPYLGDYCSISSREDMFINYVKGSYTGMELYKGDTLIQTISLPASYNATHSVDVTSYLTGGGMYKARLVGSGIASGYCYFEVVDVNVSTSLDGGNLTVTWSSASAPVSHLRLKSQVGSVRATYVLSDAEKQAGSATFDYQQVLVEQFGIGNSTTKLYARVYFKGQYGMVHADEDTGIL